MDAFLFSKKGGFEVPTNHHPIPTVPIGVSRGLLCRAMPTQLPAAPGVSWTPLGWWPVGSTGWDLYQRHLRGKVVDNEKNLSKLHGFFDIDVLGITWHWMKWHEITTWLRDFSGKAATSGSANILNTSRFGLPLSAQHGLFSECSDETGVQCLCPKRLAARWYFFLSILVVCFPFMEVLPISWVGYCSYKPEVLGKHLLLMSFQYILGKN